MDQPLQTLESARVLVVGAGALGANVVGQLGSSGVGYLGVVDGTAVGPQDLLSQTLHFKPDLGVNRAENLAAKLGVLNPEVQVDGYPVSIGPDNALAIVDGHDLVVSCLDDETARLTVNDACVETGCTLIDVVAGDEQAVVHTIVASSGSCLRCQPLRGFGGRPAAAVAGLAGSLAAFEAIRVFAGVPSRMSTRIDLDANDRTLGTAQVDCRSDCRCQAGTKQAVGKV